MLVSETGFYTMDKKFNHCSLCQPNSSYHCETYLAFLFVMHDFVRQRLPSGELGYSPSLGEECGLVVIAAHLGRHADKITHKLQLL